MDLDYYNKSKRRRTAIEEFDISLCPEGEDFVISLINDFDFLPFPIEKEVSKFQRLTINRNLPDNNNTTINEIKFLKNRLPESINGYSRANLKNQSVFYATSLLPTALYENTPEVGDFITISDWELRERDTCLIVYPIFDYFKSKDFQLLTSFNKAMENLPKELNTELDKDKIIEDNCLIASAFSKFVEKGKEINYTLSAHISSRIFNEFYNGMVEAIIYPSVKDPIGTSNFAIKPEVVNEKYRLAKVRECEVISKDQYGICLQELKRSYKFDEFIYWSKGEFLESRIEF